MTCAYMVELVAAVYFTRATSRRVVGALAGGAAVGCMGLGAIALGNALGLWRVPIAWTPYFLALFYLGLAISCSPIYLITWRVARRFGWRGLAVFISVVAIIGPPREQSEIKQAMRTVAALFELIRRNSSTQSTLCI